MAKVAKKKTVDNSKGYEFVIKEKDVVERVHFGSFEVIKTKGGMMFKNYTGFHVYTTPYAVASDGVAHKNTLYQWLENLLETHKLLSEHLDEPFGEEKYDDGRPVLNRDIYDMQRMTTEANLLQPLTAFVDPNRAVKSATEYMDWLADMQQQLLDTMNATPPSEEEAVIADAEEGAKALASEEMERMISEAEKEIPDAQ